MQVLKKKNNVPYRKIFLLRHIGVWTAMFFLMGVVYSCSDIGVSPTPPDDGGNDSIQDTTNTDTTGGNYNFHSEYAYNVNVIYFVPNDLQAKNNWHSRLSGFLLYYQDYYQKWMEHWGFGSKTFGLLKDQGRVKITRIDGIHPASYYPNHVNTDGIGGVRIKKEVLDYFNSHPTDKVTSKSYMVYIPRPAPHPVEGLPYYTQGRWAFIEDHDQDPANVEHVGGGDAHELGHALGLQHNAEPLPERNELGNALMHNGNHVWNSNQGASETSLTQADAEILNVSQTFSKQTDDFYGVINDELIEASGNHQNGNILISGKFMTDNPVTSVIVLLDPPGQEDYNRYGFKSSMPTPNSFDLSINKERLILRKDQIYGVQIWLIHQNGSRTQFNLPGFSFNDGVPEVNFHVGTVSTMAKSNWKLIDFSDEATPTNKLAANIIDDDFGTWWHSDFTGEGTPHPHYLTVDMDEKKSVEGFQFVQVLSSHRNSRIKKIQIQVSSDGSTWQNLGQYQLNDIKLPQQITLDNELEFRYFKLITHSSWKDPDYQAASLAEVGVF